MNHESFVRGRCKYLVMLEGDACCCAVNCCNFWNATQQAQGSYTQRCWSAVKLLICTLCQVYKCGKITQCPGGLPAQCSGGLVDVPCAQCPEGTWCCCLVKLKRRVFVKARSPALRCPFLVGFLRKTLKMIRFCHTVFKPILTRRGSTMDNNSCEACKPELQVLWVWGLRIFKKRKN